MSAYIDKFRELKPAFKDSTDEELIPYLHEKYASDMPISEFYKKIGVEDPNAPGDMSRGYSTGMEQLKQTGYGILAVGGATAEHFLGEGGISTGIKKAGLAGYQEQEAKIAETAKPSDEAIYSWEKAKEGDFGALADWMQYGIGQAGSQAVQALATAGLGAFVAKQGVKYAGKELAEKLVQSQAAKIAETEATKIAAGELTKEAIEQQATKMVAEKIGNIGATTALGGLAVTQEGGEIGGDLVAKAEKEGRPLTGEELAKAFGYSLGAGALEFVGDKFGLDVLTGKTKFGKTLGGMEGVGGRVARGTVAGLTTAPVEAGTEYGQTLLEEAGKGNDPFSEQARKNAINAAWQGAFGGNVMGMAGGMLTAPIANATTVDDAIANAEKALSGQKLIPQLVLDKEGNSYDRNQLLRNFIAQGNDEASANAYIDKITTPEIKAQPIDLAPYRELQAKNAGILGIKQPTSQADVEALNEPTTQAPVAPTVTAEEIKKEFVPTHILTNSNTPVVKTGLNDYVDARGSFFTRPDEFVKPIESETNQEQPINKEIKPKFVIEAKTTGAFANADEANAFIRKQKRQSGNATLQFLPRPFKDGTFGIAIKNGDGWNDAVAYQQNPVKAPVTAQQPVQPIVDTKAPVVKTKPVEFTPTHELNDGTPVIKVDGENNVYTDVSGNEWEADDAVPIVEPVKAPETQPVAQEQAPTIKPVKTKIQPSQLTNDFIPAGTELIWKRGDKSTTIKAIENVDLSGLNNDAFVSGFEINGGQADATVGHLKQLVSQTLSKNEAPIVAQEQTPAIKSVETKPIKEIPPETQQLRKGTVGGNLSAGEVVITSSGRQTTPFPKFQTKEGNVKPVHLKAVDKWLMRNAFEEAKAKGDKFNARQFEANLDKPSQADKDSAEEYLFGEQPAIEKPILKPLVKEKPSEMEDLKSQMGQAIGELASLLGGKTNLTEEEETKLIPIMSKIFRIAAKMGYVKFKDAAQHVMSQIRELAGDEVADKLSIENLQAGYINIAKEIGGDKREALQYESIEELEGDKNAVEKQETTQLDGSRGTQSRVREEGEDASKGRAGIRESGQEERDISEVTPGGWTKSPSGKMMTNPDRKIGGIIDTNMVSGKWFFVPNNDNLKIQENFDTWKDAYDALQLALKKIWNQRNC